MKKNEVLEQAFQELKETGETWASWDVLRAYKQSRENQNSLLNIHEINDDFKKSRDQGIHAVRE